MYGLEKVLAMIIKLCIELHDYIKRKINEQYVNQARELDEKSYITETMNNVYDISDDTLSIRTIRSSFTKSKKFFLISGVLILTELILLGIFHYFEITKAYNTTNSLMHFVSYVAILYFFYLSLQWLYEKIFINRKITINSETDKIVIHNLIMTKIIDMKKIKALGLRYGSICYSTSIYRKNWKRILKCHNTHDAIILYNILAVHLPRNVQIDKRFIPNWSDSDNLHDVFRANFSLSQNLDSLFFEGPNEALLYFKGEFFQDIASKYISITKNSVIKIKHKMHYLMDNWYKLRPFVYFSLFTHVLAISLHLLSYEISCIIFAFISWLVLISLIVMLLLKIAGYFIYHYPNRTPIYIDRKNRTLKKRRFILSKTFMIKDIKRLSIEDKNICLSFYNEDTPYIIAESKNCAELLIIYNILAYVISKSILVNSNVLIQDMRFQDEFLSANKITFN